MMFNVLMDCEKVAEKCGAIETMHLIELN